MKSLWKTAILCLTLVMLCVSGALGMETAGFELTAQIGTNAGAVEVRSSTVGDETYLFLPSFASLEELTLLANGKAVSWEETDQEEDVRILAVQAGPEEELSIRVMQADTLRAVFLFSDDPVNQGRAYIDNCEKHVNSTTASVMIVNEQGQADHIERIRKLRGRGNGTWGNAKKPYQFKLEDRTDLLDTGIADERERTFLLLAEASDDTMLHNRITLDMGLELGLQETSHSEHVDLYYDGEYRGVYLLAEKTEIGTGRVDERDYDDLIETWNDKVGQTDLELLPAAEGTNRFGNLYTYIDGVAESDHPDAGAFLLEMEVAATTLSDRCYFRMSDGSILASKNPENASQSMMDFISTRLQEARNTLINGGVNPENGRTIEDDFDVDAFARTMLVQEVSYNYDGYKYSSSFFVLPAQEMRFRPGPLWDFDIAYRYMANGQTADGAGFKEASGWMYDFYQCPQFVQAAKTIYVEELYPMVQKILLGQDEGRYLKPLDAYAAQIEASRRMNAVLWGSAGRLNRYLYGRGYEEEFALLKQFIDQRSQWLYDVFSQDEEANTVTLWVNAVYAHVDESLRVLEKPWNPAFVAEVSWTQLTEADEENYALWQLELLMEPKDGREVETVVINGEAMPYERLEDGKLLILAAFEDPSYRPVDYYGEDIGWVYNYDEYIARYPEVAEECEYDEQMVMDYFCDEGMYEDHMGNAFFRPSDILAAHPELEETLGEDWWNYYWEFLYYGHSTDKWLMYMGNKSFWPEWIHDL